MLFFDRRNSKIVTIKDFLRIISAEENILSSVLKIETLVFVCLVDIKNTYTLK